MDKIRIIGGNELEGKIHISGAKNAALPLMASSILTEKPLILQNMPNLADVRTMSKLLENLGISVSTEKKPFNQQLVNETTFVAKGIKKTTAPYELVKQMRASVLVLGPLIAKHGKAKVSLPGGCAIGTRPIDLHIDALEKMGAKIVLEEGYIKASVDGRLKGAQIMFPMVTVGGTENVLMAATLAEGTTTIINAAQEPEITDLANALVSMGAKIEGIGTSKLVIKGVEELNGATHPVIFDRIEAATYAIATAATRGKVELIGAKSEVMASCVRVLLDLGVLISDTKNGVLVNAQDAILVGTDVMTEPHPGFPTDLQAQMMALMATAHGASMITESIFENRFMHVPELCRMGANINIHGNSSAIVRGVKALSGAQVMATDLRASVSLVIAGLSAKGETIINRVYHLDRGYEKLEEKLASCGAKIERISD